MKIIKKSDLLKTLAEGVNVTELIDKDMTLIGGDDEVVSNTAVTSNSTTDSHVAAVTQQNGNERANGIQALDIVNTSIMEDESLSPEVNDLGGLKAMDSIVGKNLEILIDSIKRRGVDPKIILNILISEFNHGE